MRLLREPGRNVTRQILRRDDVLILENHRPLDDVSQLAHVARPAVTAKRCPHLPPEPSDVASQDELLVESFNVMLSEQQDVVISLSERRNVYQDDGEAVKEVEPEAP